MGKIDPNDIVKRAQMALSEGWGYIWGTAGEMWTEAKQKAVENDPNGREQTKKYGRQWIGHTVADCSGLVKWIFKQLGMNVAHGSNTQYLKYCPERGEIKKDTVLKPGCGVFKYDGSMRNPYYHVGIYVGDGKVIEAQGTYKGVVKSSLFGWSHYGYWKNVDWGNAKMETVQRGSKNAAVKELQEKLNTIGYSCGTADGIFGEKTEKAVKDFQAVNGLKADGVVGEDTWAKLDAIYTAWKTQVTTSTDIPTGPQMVPANPETLAMFTTEQYQQLCQARDLMIAVLGNG